MSAIPEKMKALVLEKYGVPPKCLELPVPKPEGTQILVRIEVAPLNPADLSHMKGYYSSTKELPVTIGLEGAGVVVDAGTDSYARSLIG